MPREVEACQIDPDGEACVCHSVREFALIPREYEDNPDYDRFGDLPQNQHRYIAKNIGGSSAVPQLGTDGYWTGEPEDLHVPENMANPLYNQHCTLSYLREDLRRLWYFAAALGGGFAALSLAWAGVMYMQHSASGVDLTRSRMMIMRVLLGVLILAFAFVVWEGLGDVLLDTLDPWSQDRSVFYDDVIR